MIRIAVVFPSRGLAFSQTAQELLDNLLDYDHEIFFAHELPIPDCFNVPLRNALAGDFSHIWFVEDDMVLKKDTLKRLLEKDKAVVTIDYPVNKKGRGSVFKVGKEVIFCGTGCLLVKREVFAEFRDPIFRTDFRWNIKNYGYLKMTVNEVSNLDGYGLHDVNFCMRLYQLKIPIHVIAGKLAQRKLVSLGRAGTNDGAHNIELWNKLIKNHLLDTVKSWPVLDTGKLITVTTPTGEITVSEGHGKNLIKKGLAVKTSKKALVVDWGKF